jgi:hypothetical protein
MSKDTNDKYTDIEIGSKTCKECYCTILTCKHSKSKECHCEHKQYSDCLYEEDECQYCNDEDITFRCQCLFCLFDGAYDFDTSGFKDEDTDFAFRVASNIPKYGMKAKKLYPLNEKASNIVKNIYELYKLGFESKNAK